MDDVCIFSTVQMRYLYVVFMHGFREDGFRAHNRNGRLICAHDRAFSDDVRRGI